MSTDTPNPHASWPFPAADHFRRAAAPKADSEEPSSEEDAPDLVEQELVEEQLERDRKASKAVDSNLKSGNRH